MYKMAQQQIGDLFDNSRWPSGVPLMLAVLYFPFGLLLAILRIFIGFHTFLGSCLLPKLAFIRNIVLRVMCLILGIVVTVDGEKQQKRDKSVKVMVANYTSTMDHLAVDLIQPSILPCVWDLPPSLMWLLGYVDMGAKKGRDTLIDNAKRHCKESKVPLLVFPEGASTNGKNGLLKFSTWPFSLDEPVQPVLIQIKRPVIARLSPSILGGRWWRDVFWSLFVPYTSFHIRFLSPETKQVEESIEDFTKRIQVTMAKELGLQATGHTTVDKVAYAKRTLIVSKAPTREVTKPTSPPPVGVDENVRIMVAQVQEVLPHISARVIQQDLALTKDVDLTITNILEGKVDGQQTNDTNHKSATYTKQQSSPSSSAKSAPSPTKASTAASSFSRSSHQRHMSLEERKQALIDIARQKYIEKHGLST